MARRYATNLVRWQRSLATIASKPSTVVFVGSSTTQGTVASTASRRYIELLGTMLRNRLNATSNTHTHISTSAEDTTIDKTGTITRSYSGLSRQNYVMSPGATLTIPFSGQAFTVLYTRGSGIGAFTVSIDGGAATTITPSTSGALAHTESSTISGLSAGAHTAVITAVGTTRFCGAVAHSNLTDRGLYVYNSGFGGATTQMFADDAAFSERLNALSPNLVVIMLGSNDYATNVSIGTFMQKTAKIITDIRSNVASQPDILLVHSYKRFDITSPAYSWETYGAALRAVATDTGCDFVDISGAYPSSQSTDIIRPGSGHIAEGLISNDGIHQTDYGYSFMANLLLDTLL